MMEAPSRTCTNKIRRHSESAKFARKPEENEDVKVKESKPRHGASAKKLPPEDWL